MKQLPPAALGLRWITERERRKEKTGNDEYRKENESPLPNHFVCARGSQRLDFVSVQTGGLGLGMIPVFSRSPIQEGRDGDGRGEEEDESALVARPDAKLCNKELLAKQRTNVFPTRSP